MGKVVDEGIGLFQIRIDGSKKKPRQIIIAPVDLQDLGKPLDRIKRILGTVDQIKKQGLFV